MTVTEESTEGVVNSLRDQLRQGSPKKLEQLGVELLSAFMEQPFYIARGGFQHGADGGTAGMNDRHMRVECKRYADTTPIDDRELRGEIDDALIRNPALETWILVATRPVDETTREKLLLKSEEVGIPIVVFDWTCTNGDMPDLAALCAYSPSIVQAIYGNESGELAHALASTASDRWALMRESLNLACIGLPSIKRAADQNIETIWTSESEAKSQFAQNIAIGACNSRIERSAISNKFEAWFEQPVKEPAVVIGDEGVGKTWAVIQWVKQKLGDLPITLLIPSSAFCEIRDLTPPGIHDFLARELSHLAGVRSKDFWRRRLGRMLNAASHESPCLLLMIDGMNQDPSFQWVRLLQILQGEHFSGVRVIVTSQRHFFSQDLNQLRGLASLPKVICVEPYDITPSGELDQMLQMHEMVRADLADDVVPLARNPRMFPLVIRFREQMATQGDITPLRLLWAYGQDELGLRVGRAFTDSEWQEWLHTLAKSIHSKNQSLIDNTPQVPTFSISDLSNSVSVQHRSASENLRRLNEIVNGTWMEPIPGSATKYRPRAEIIALAFGLGIIERLLMVDEGDAASELSSLIDPVRASSSTADALAAALSIAVAVVKSQRVITSITIELLHSQNATEAHLREIVSVAPAIPIALLDSMEHSSSRAHATARHWVLSAIRRIPETNHKAWNAVLCRLEIWAAVTDCPSPAERKRNDEVAQYRSNKLVETIGIDTPGMVEVLGVNVALRPFSEPYLGAEVARILQGRRLNCAMRIFKAAAISRTLGSSRSETWTGLKWLLIFDSRTRTETLSALSQMADEIMASTAESYIHKDVKARVAALLLWLPDDSAMDARALQINPPSSAVFNYDTDYLDDPVASYFALERRHLDAVLSDDRLTFKQKSQRLKKLLADPTFCVPDGIVAASEKATRQFPVSRLSQGRFYTAEEHEFDELEVPAARFSPVGLTKLCRRRLRDLGKRHGQSLHWASVKAPEYLLVARNAELKAVRIARQKYDLAIENEEQLARSHLLQIEIPFLHPYDQLCAMAAEERAWLSIQLLECTKPCSPEEIDMYIKHTGLTSSRSVEVLFNHLARHETNISADAFETLFPFSQTEASRNHRVIAFMALTNCAPERFGKCLIEVGWTVQVHQSIYEMDSGSLALLAASKSNSLNNLASKVAPWRLLHEACLRADHSSFASAADSISKALTTTGRQDDPPPVIISVEAADRFSRTSFDEKGKEEDDPVKAFDETYQLEKWNRLQDRGRSYVSETRKRGAILYHVNFSVDEVRLLVLQCATSVDAWLNGMEAETAEFRARVNNASSFFLALCQALLEIGSERGATLWRYLDSSMPIRIIGQGGVREHIHVLFRVSTSPPVDVLRDDLFSIRRNVTEKHYFDIVVAALANGATDWLNGKVSSDESSGSCWRLKRAVMMRGMMDLPSVNNLEWPAGREMDDVTRAAMLMRNRQALAYYWWERYLSEESLSDAFAAWTLFIANADRRCWIWLSDVLESCRERNSRSNWQLKMCHFEANRTMLNKAVRDQEEKGTQLMAQQLWGLKSPATLLDMELVEGN